MCDIDRLKAPGGRAHKQSSNWRISSFSLSVDLFDLDSTYDL